MSTKGIVQDECLECKSFNKKANDYYYCAIEGSCPGIDWTEEEKEEYLKKMEKNINNLLIY